MLAGLQWRYYALRCNFSDIISEVFNKVWTPVLGSGECWLIQRYILHGILEESKKQSLWGLLRAIEPPQLAPGFHLHLTGARY